MASVGGDMAGDNWYDFKVGKKALGKKALGSDLKGLLPKSIMQKFILNTRPTSKSENQLL